MSASDEHPNGPWAPAVRAAPAGRPAPHCVSCSPLPPDRPTPPITSPSTTIGKPPTKTAKRPSKLHWMPKASLPGSAGPLGARVEQVRRALVAGGGEGLVPGDLRSGDAGAVHAFHHDRVAAFVGDADGFQDADFLGLAHGGRDHGAGFVEFQLRAVSFSWSGRCGQTAAVHGLGLRVELQAGAARFAEGGDVLERLRPPKGALIRLPVVVRLTFTVPDWMSCSKRCM